MSLLLMFMGARAQLQLTVYEGSVTETHLPAYVYYFDEFTRSQYVIPAADLTAMADGVIKGLKYYVTITDDNVPYTTGSDVDVYMKEVDYTTMSGFEPKADCSVVYHGKLNFVKDNDKVNDGSLTIVFDQPFLYSGGNLLIGIDNTTNVDYKRQYFYGTRVTGTGYSGSSSTSPDAISGSVYGFIPTTTFSYVPAGDYYQNPQDLTASDILSTSATLSWTAPGTDVISYAYQYKLNDSASEWSTEVVTTDTSVDLSDLLPVTNYMFRVKAIYPEGESFYSTVSFATMLYDDYCTITLELTDTYGDGWNGSSITVTDVATGYVIGEYANQDQPNQSGAETTTYRVSVPNGKDIKFQWTSGQYVDECVYTIYDVNGYEIHSGSGAMSDLVYTVDCTPHPQRPANLTTSNITATGATLSWEGSHDSYVLQYKPWIQVGEDILATASLKTYTYDLSEFSGTGSIAIRHYDVSDLFFLNVDDIVVTDPEGQIVFSEDFESSGGAMPIAFSLTDLDGDGYNWGVRDFDNSNTDNPVGNGNYCATSASWTQGSGALTPDNWLLIPNVPLGGTLTFVARGQDPIYPGENFGVFVCVDANETELLLDSSPCEITNLIPNTSYVWQVKGVIGEEESAWRAASFVTLDNLIVFEGTTDSNWHEPTNWNPVGVPTSADKVRIDAPVVILPDNIAQARKVTLGTSGEINIMNGGQLKQGSATLKVTMNKVINSGTPAIIASPFTGRTQIGYSDTWSNVTGLTSGDFNFYAFDYTQELEWINYKMYPSHIAFSTSSLEGLIDFMGYYYSTADDRELVFTGVTPSSCNNVITKTLTYDDTSTAPFNGWALLGNPFTCDGYITYSEPATFYKLNAAADGYEAYDGAVVLAPGEGAFIYTQASGTITYSSEVGAVSPVEPGATLPVNPLPGFPVCQDASGPADIAIANSVDNTNTINDYSNSVCNVTLTDRTLFCDNEWNTLCLPFSLNADQIANGSLAGADIRSLTSASLSEETLTLIFTPVDNIEAGKPYIIKWASGADITNPQFKGVLVSSNTSNFKSDDETIEFLGTYSMTAFDTEVTDILFMDSGSQLKWPLPGATIGACRAYFKLADGSPAKHFVLTFGSADDDDDITAINGQWSMVNGQSSMANDEWYTLSGVRLNGKPSAKGIYIHNGKKIVVQ